MSYKNNASREFKSKFKIQHYLVRRSSDNTDCIKFFNAAS